MARKDRAPAPPRGAVQAPKQRRSQSGPPDPARTRRLLYLVAGSGVLALLVVVAIIVFAGGGSGKDEKVVLAENGCTLDTYPGLTGTHVTSLTAKVKWNSDPPTSGAHLVQPAVWGSYDEPIAEIQAVHNLEHGGIVIQYGKDVPQAEVEKIRSWYEQSPNALIVAPLDSLGAKIALSAWTAPANVGTTTDNGNGYLAKCDAFNEKAFDTFVENHRGQGPERFPVDQLTPGS